MPMLFIGGNKVTVPQRGESGLSMLCRTEYSDSNTPASVPTLPKINRQDTGCGLPTALVSVSIAVINTLTKIKLGRKGFSSDYSL